MKLFTEYPEREERTHFQRVTEQVTLNLEKLYGDKPRALRDTHAKTHACVRGTLEIFDFDESAIKARLKQTVLSDRLSDDEIDAIVLKQGLFSTPQRYPVWIRFANGRTEVEDDYIGDARSMSVKVMEVEGDRLPDSHEAHTQDLITQNAEIFFIKTIKNYYGFFKFVVKGGLWPLLWLIFHPFQLLALQSVTKRYPKSLLTQRCWSGSASALGLPDNFESLEPGQAPVQYPVAVKYGFTPVACDAPHQPLPEESREWTSRAQAKRRRRASNTPDHYYREELIQSLAQPEAKYCWNFDLQIQTAPKQSIDDVTVIWPEDKAPFFTVGRLTVAHQVIDFEAQCTFCENLRFSPWNGLAVHRPIGALNRLRAGVYRQVGEYRLRKQGLKYQEPTGEERFE
ncbi:MAG: catalase [Cyanobacteria bacterium J06634_5]